MMLALAAWSMTGPGCSLDAAAPTPAGPTPAQLRATLNAALPNALKDRAGWSADLQAAFAALELPPNAQNVCATVAIIEQESSFQVDPPVPGLAAIAWREIDTRAERAGVPSMIAHAALKLEARGGKTFSDRIDAVRTEKELSDIFVDFIDQVPLGKQLFASYNPVRTGGPMQVGIAFAEQYPERHRHPRADGRSIRDEVFTRRGGLFFGIAHLLDYRADYDRLLYRFADFNAGQYASRNAAFQQAVALVSGQRLELDGDLLRYHGDTDEPGMTERATMTLAQRLQLEPGAIRVDLERGRFEDFSRSVLYQRVFALAERQAGKALARSVVPRIAVKSPKFKRRLSTEWFAGRVDDRYQRCLSRVAAPS